MVNAGKINYFNININLKIFEKSSKWSEHLVINILTNHAAADEDITDEMAGAGVGGAGDDNERVVVSVMSVLAFKLYKTHN